MQVKNKIILTSNWEAKFQRTYENQAWLDVCANTNFEISFASTDNFYKYTTASTPYATINMNQSVNENHYRFLRHSELRGSKVINNITASKIADDKFLSNLELQSHGISVPKTLDFTPLFLDVNLLNWVEENIGFPCILKPSNSAAGCGVVKIDDKLQLKDISELIFLSASKYGDTHHNSNYIVQELITNSIGRDLRIVILNGECLGSMMRVSNFDWKPRKAPVPNPQLDNSYVTYSKYLPEPELINQAINITKILGINYAGLDVFFGEDGYIFGEINTNPGLYRFETCHPGLKVVPLLFEYLNKK